jgi:Domain of unknown function (DUF4907)
MKIHYLVIVLFIASCSDNSKPEKKIDREQNETKIEKKVDRLTQSNKKTTQQSNSTASKLIAKPIFDTQTGWGYDIYDGAKLLVHQPHIPAIQGNHGFESADQALVVANKVIEKIDAGIMPPSLSIEELKKLGVQIP